MRNKQLFTSTRPDWETPLELIRAVEKYAFQGKRFQLDAAAEAHNAICRAYLKDAFAKPWPGKKRTWCNPPYGRTSKRKTGAWLERGADAAFKRNSEVVFLLPARTDTKWFHTWSATANVKLLPGRLVFGASEAWTDPKTWRTYPPVDHAWPAPFPSCLFFFPGAGRIDTWDWREWV